MLHRVREFGLKSGESEPGFKPQYIRWALVFSEAGEFQGVKELGDAEQKRNLGLLFAKCPRIDRTGKAVWSQFLWDDLGTLLGWGKDESETRKLRGSQEFFLARLLEAASAHPPLGLCAQTLAIPATCDEAIRLLKANRTKPSDKATLEIGGEVVAGSAWAAEWWRGNRARVIGLIGKGSKAGSSGEVRCLLTGERSTAARIHPFIQGMSDVGGNAKSALISFNEAAYCSFGLGQSANCAISEQAASEYSDALNRLIATRSRRLISYRQIQMARNGKKGLVSQGETVWRVEQAKPGQDAKAILWFDRFDLNDALDTDVLLDPCPIEGLERREAEQAEQRGLKLLTAISRGERPELDGAIYYSAVLSSATSRVMVRSWQEGPLTEFASAVCQWFSDLEMADAETGATGREPAFARLIGTLARKKADVAPSLVMSLWLAATQNTRISPGIAAQVLRRMRIEIVEGFTPRREAAALLKAWLLRDASRKEEGMQPVVGPCLREDHPNPAYQCGRLMAALAALQRAALGDVGAGVIQRYFSSASATPSLVFGRLLRSSQHHLQKLDAGLRNVMEGRIASIAARIGDTYPASLGLEGQSMFALGYYQQIAEDRRLRQLAKAKKESQANA